MGGHRLRFAVQTPASTVPAPSALAVRKAPTQSARRAGTAVVRGIRWVTGPCRQAIAGRSRGHGPGTPPTPWKVLTLKHHRLSGSSGGLAVPGAAWGRGAIADGQASVPGGTDDGRHGSLGESGDGQRWVDCQRAGDGGAVGDEDARMTAQLMTVIE